MFIFFYKPNFCADCGEKLFDKNHFWTQKLLLKTYFCKNCFIRLKLFLVKQFIIHLTLSAVLILSTNTYINSLKRPTANSKDSSLPTKLINNTINSPIVNKPNTLLKNDEVYLCGARTLKGKKCQRRVKTLGHCWQHQTQK
jgi:hypothetical protein